MLPSFLYCFFFHHPWKKIHLYRKTQSSLVGSHVVDSMPKDYGIMAKCADFSCRNIVAFGCWLKSCVLYSVSWTIIWQPLRGRPFSSLPSYRKGLQRGYGVRCDYGDRPVQHSDWLFQTSPNPCLGPFLIVDRLCLANVAFFLFFIFPTSSCEPFRMSGKRTSLVLRRSGNL